MTVDHFVTRTRENLPGLGIAAIGVAIAWCIHLLVPAIPLLTLSILLGFLVAQIPAVRAFFAGAPGPGLTFSGKVLMRVGVALLGLKISLSDIASLGWVALLSTLAIVVITFFATWGLGLWAKLPGQEPVLLAAGFSICGASAVGAVAGVTRASKHDQATPVAMVTLCGSLAIAVLPLLQRPLGFTDREFGQFVGASVHDVGQVVATAQIAGAAALAFAVTVKLTRVITLAPMVAIIGAIERRKGIAPGTKRPPIVPFFVCAFLVAVLLRTFVPIPDAVLSTADTAQTIVLALALFALGSAINVKTLVTKGAKSAGIALVSWILIAGLSIGAVELTALTR